MCSAVNLPNDCKVACFMNEFQIQLQASQSRSVAGGREEGRGGWQPTLACKTRFTIKAKVVDNTTTTTTTTTMWYRKEGRGRGIRRGVTSGVEPRAVQTERCVCRSFSFIKGNGFGSVFWHMLRPVWLWMSHRGVQHVMATSPRQQPSRCVN